MLFFPLQNYRAALESQTWFSMLLNCSDGPLAEVWPRLKSTLGSLRISMSTGIFSVGNLDVDTLFGKVIVMGYPLSA